MTANRRYSGLWRVRSTSDTQDLSPLGAADPMRHMDDWTSETHAVDDTATTRQAIVTDARLDFPPALLYDSDDTYAADNARPNGPVSNEPDDHGLNDDSHSDNGAQRRMSAQPTSLHSRDLGEAQAIEYHEPMILDEKDDSEFRLANRNVARSHLALVRGANSYAENNPEFSRQRTPGDAPNGASVGWAATPRIGQQWTKFIERTIEMHRPKHDYRPIWNKVARTAGDTPAGQNRYASPFDDLVSPRQKIALTPAMRREPRDWSDNATIDGTEDPSASYTESYNSWGL